MYSDGSALRQLTRDECLRLLATAPIGRIIYTRQAMPAVELTNFVLDRGDIVIRTDRSGKLAAAARGAIVAFEADVVDTEHCTGWSVTAIGPSTEVTDAAELARLRDMDLSSWAPGLRDHFIRVSPQLLNGRWLGVARRAVALGETA
jgi:nitroimidazol reductase NimA-like FMN-containing flavoprotein (pyridoxamine 5'-phosphate oxidase superfamily)